MQQHTVQFDEKKVDAIFAQIDQCHLPGLAVGIAIKGRPVYRKGFGLANMELPLALSPSTRMRIYSASKHFTSLAYLLLCENGKAGIDDPAAKHFPEFRRALGSTTMRQLMGNISGIRDAHGLNFQFCGTAWVAPSSEVIELYRTIQGMDAESGTTWIYNNGGFVLLGHAVETLSGESLESFLRRRVFEPVGMYDTLLRRTDLDFLPNSAAMHMTTPQGGFVKSYVGGDRAGTGGIVSTINDMLRWLAHMDEPQIGSSSTWNALKEPQRLASGTSTNYGCGLILESYRGIEMLHHQGGGMGANAQMLKIPSVGLDIVMMVNRQDVSSRELSLRVIDVCVHGLQPHRPAPTVPVVTGTFRSRSTGRIIYLFQKDGYQIGAISGFSDMRLESDELGVLRPSKALTTVPYQCAIALVGNTNSPAALRYAEYGIDDELIPVAPVANPDFAKIEGSYRSDGTGFKVYIRGTEMQASGPFGSVQYHLECIGEDIWRAEAVTSLATFMKGFLSFNDDSFKFSSYCTRALDFQRS